MTTQITRPALRYHGAKFRLAPWIISFFPPHQTYVEPFGGAAGVLLQKERAYAEIYNDLDGDVANFFRVLRNPLQRAMLIEAITMTPYSRSEFEQAWEPATDPIEQARRLAIRAQMGFGSAGATKGQTGFRIDSRREYGTAQQLWAYYPDQLADVGQRLAGVLIENAPAIDVMRQHDSVQTLHFVDPPYLHETRVLQ
ncbi:DNA adenine methylase, partial [Chromobacterium phragmitis]